ncbi:2-phosphosulfolactate phosphatase [Isoalcanivorax beigongshangi]|uniref:Probable 2-phosphosulfolactate phosphatase n=1 Tax=Isoalcanivorax beigongshangi TaxID=3238810 RepID=A0ABV4AMB6_9GAMM
MNIDIVQGHFPPPNPDGATVVIDVIRAFTTSYYAFCNGVRTIYPVATPEAAFDLKADHPDALLAGEIDALPIAGFDFGNSPWEMQHADLAGRPLILRTTNGVIATLNAFPCAHLFVAGLVNADATAEAIAALGVDQVVLVASHPTGDEDLACAQYLRGRLGGDGISLDEAVQRTRDARAARKFLSGDHPRLRAADIELAATPVETAFALRVHSGDPLQILPEPRSA